MPFLRACVLSTPTLESTMHVPLHRRFRRCCDYFERRLRPTETERWCLQSIVTIRGVVYSCTCSLHQRFNKLHCRAALHPPSLTTPSSRGPCYNMERFNSSALSDTSTCLETIPYTVTFSKTSSSSLHPCEPARTNDRTSSPS